MLKDEQNCSYNGGGYAMPLKTWSDFSSIQYFVERGLKYIEERSTDDAVLESNLVEYSNEDTRRSEERVSSLCA